MSSDISDRIKPKAPLFHRLAVKVFSVLLTIVLFWVLGFLVRDINKIEGPNISVYNAQYLDHSLLSQQRELSRRIKKIRNTIENQQVNQTIIKNSTEGLQKTIGQILEIQKLDKASNTSRTQEESKAFSDSLNLFLTNQKKFQKLNVEISSLTEKQQQLDDEYKTIDKKLSGQRSLAKRDYRKAQYSHRVKIALYKLSLLIPLLLLSLFLAYRFKSSNKLPLLLPFSIATMLKVSLVIHEHFPSKLFKYILVLVLLVVLIKLLMYFIKVVAAPKKEVLVKQYREAYERFQCPLCEYPIRRGPMKYLYWTRKTLKKIKLLPGVYEDEEYNCPSCGTSLYQQCNTCTTIRHSLLPYCVGCNTEKDILVNDDT